MCVQRLFMNTRGTVMWLGQIKMTVFAAKFNVIDVSVFVCVISGW